MPKQLVLLVCSQRLYGEGLESLLNNAGDLELIGPFGLNEDISDRISELNLDVVIIADEDPNSEEVVKITNLLMKNYPDLPIIRTGLIQNMFFIVETHALPARGSDLLETIRGFSVGRKNKGNA